MTNYHCDCENVADDRVWYVAERPTGNIIKRNMTWEQASNLTKRLNGGHGFAGWTPRFLLERLVVSETY